MIRPWKATKCAVFHFRCARKTRSFRRSGLLKADPYDSIHGYHSTFAQAYLSWWSRCIIQVSTVTMEVIRPNEFQVSLNRTLPTQLDTKFAKLYKPGLGHPILILSNQSEQLSQVEVKRDVYTISSHCGSCLLRPVGLWSVLFLCQFCD